MSTLAATIRQSRESKEKNFDEQTPIVRSENNFSPPPAVACDKCACPIVWLDAYGGWHCGECVPPRVAAQVRRKLILAAAASGQEVWRDHETDIDCPSQPDHAAASPTAFPPDGQSPAPPARGGAGGWQLSGVGPSGTHASRYCCPGGGDFARHFSRKTSEEKILETDQSKKAAGEKISTPIPPANARLFFLMQDGKQIECGGKKKNSSVDRAESKLFTWEGADRWWPVEHSNPATFERSNPASNQTSNLAEKVPA